jgi:hypothetical protein
LLESAENETKRNYTRKSHLRLKPQPLWVCGDWTPKVDAALAASQIDPAAEAAATLGLR